jgi:hypothetical protein
MSKNRAKSAVVSAHYGYNFLGSNTTRLVSDSERKGIKRMSKHVRNTGPLNESRIIRIHTLDEPKALRVIGNLLRTH